MQQVGRWSLPDSDTYFKSILEASPDGFEVDHLEPALRYVKTFTVAVDVGAHIGTWTAKLAQHFTLVLAYEPAPDTFECLVENCRCVPNALLHNMAVGPWKGFGRLDDDPTRVGNTGARMLRGTPGRNGVVVTTIDNERIIGIGLIKIDVEGYEIGVLQGAVQALKRYRPVVIMECKEFNPPRHGGVKVAVKFLEALGYRKVGGIRNDWVFAPDTE